MNSSTVMNLFLSQSRSLILFSSSFSTKAPFNHTIYENSSIVKA